MQVASTANASLYGSPSPTNDIHYFYFYPITRPYRCLFEPLLFVESENNPSFLAVNTPKCTPFYYLAEDVFQEKQIKLAREKSLSYLLHMYHYGGSGINYNLTYKIGTLTID